MGLRARLTAPKAVFQSTRSSVFALGLFEFDTRPCDNILNAHNSLPIARTNKSNAVPRCTNTARFASIGMICATIEDLQELLARNTVRGYDEDMGA